MRRASIDRRTAETQIKIGLAIDGRGASTVRTPIGFLNHMLSAAARHGLFDLKLTARGDLEVDQHHTVEDCGIALGQAFDQALGDRHGINRAGFFLFPMDESVAFVALDLSGRPHLQYHVPFTERMVGGLEVGLLHDFFAGFAMSLRCALHIVVPYGRNDHHKAEAVFKAWGKALKMACAVDPRAPAAPPSTKGSL